ncbi:MAG: ankyrin repeat domain-containing protein [Bacteroidota bacterium]
MAKTAGVIYLIILFIAPVSLSMRAPAIYAQTASPSTLSDTSYFKAGEDEWNLVESVLHDDPAAVLFLLKRGASPNARAEGGMTALMFAAEGGDTTIIKLLVLNGADLELTHVEKTTPLMVAVLNRKFDAAHILLKMGADPDHRDFYGGTPLIYAAAINDYAMADLLLFFGASHNLTDRDGNTAMMTAVCLGQLECADVLLQNSSPPDSKDKKQNTPLMVAAQQDNEEMTSLLLEYRANTELVNSQNYTPLAHAIRSGSLESARILVDSGASVDHSIRKNQNLYDLAIRHKQKKIAQILKSNGATPTPYPDFSEFGLGWGNSFGTREYMMQVRLWLMDRKFGYFIETGVDFRPAYRIVQVEQNDTLIHQYREQRFIWTHGVGRYFTLIMDNSGVEYGFYGALYGMLSFPSYRGISEHPGVNYSLVPSAGLFFRGEMAGMKVGAERYRFGTLLEGRWKANITLFLRIPVKQSSYEFKEISY